MRITINSDRVAFLRWQARGLGRIELRRGQEVLATIHTLSRDTHAVRVTVGSTQIDVEPVDGWHRWRVRRVAKQVAEGIAIARQFASIELEPNSTPAPGKFYRVGGGG